MARELKFRAWDIEHHQMLNDGDYWSAENRQKGNSWICYPVSATNKGILWCKKYPRPIPEDAMEIDRTCIEGIELMQFIGLKDKNGIEVFESDILGLNLKPFYMVVWNEKEAMYNLADLSGKPVPDFDFENYEVISNIYESPELLEGAR